MRGRRGICALMLAAALSLSASPAARAIEARIFPFSALDGWDRENHAEAFDIFLQICPDLDKAEWDAVCAFARTRPDPRMFFETFFRPVRIGPDDEAALFTAYFEPELPASRWPNSTYRYPLYRLPPELRPGAPFLTRAEIDMSGALAGRGLEIAWLRDPVDLYYLQIQGSGRLRFPDGQVLRLGYGGQNGHPRRSVAQEMVRRGIVPGHRASAPVIRNWVRANPAQGRAMLHHDPSYVFFRVLEDQSRAPGPRGAMNRALVPGRSIAVDPAFTPLGAPVWVEKDGAAPLRRLMFAQDTGGAIKGPQRADIFIGTGDAAGSQAGAIRDPGRMVVLLPIERAFVLALGE
jgi:membrane-bound lytic murein transglycosylase A